jgi:glutaredoxin
MKILFPPHAHIRIASSKLNEYENSKNWIAQRKFNGTNVLVYISRDKKVSILTRHGTAPKLFSLTKSHVEQILSLNLEKDKDYWLNGELLDHKTKDKDYKGKIVFFDVLHAGRYLIQNPSQIERLELLKNICNYPSGLEKNGIAYSTVNVLEDTIALEFIKSQGHKTVPQIYFNNELLVEG